MARPFVIPVRLGERPPRKPKPPTKGRRSPA
jgi:hypothetical protein